MLRARILRAAFGMLYRSRTLYWLASTIPFAGNWRVWQRRVLGRVTGQDVLEIGPGIGYLFADMVRAGYRCTAVDASPQMVKATRDELRRQRLVGRGARILLARVQALPFADASFDTVISTFPTEYINDNAAIHEIARVLRPGGRVIVVVAATLLPASPLLAPLALFQALVYGEPLRQRSKGGAGRASDQVRTEVLSPQRDGIPLEAAGLRRQTERDVSRDWIVNLTIGTKSLEPIAGP